ncbi:hypothetical protein [Anaerovibrio sp.]|uniref:hypothetical protein n=1 Tax=Anaerovibrio sp. TaxID=1872532 RepID=UPI003F18C0C8
MDFFKNKEKWIFSAAVAVCVAVVLWAGGVEAARADRYFVDYEGNTGYYVDVNSIEQPSEHEIELDLYLVKLHSRYMYRYRAYFDTEEGSYEYRNAKVYNYETKKLMSGAVNVQERLSYGKSTMLQEVVEFALAWKKSHIYKTQYGETWE